MRCSTFVSINTFSNFSSSSSSSFFFVRFVQYSFYSDKLDYFTDWLTGKQRGKKEVPSSTIKDSSPPPPPPSGASASSSTDLVTHLTSSSNVEMPSSSSTTTSSSSHLPMSSSSSSGLIYLQPEFAVFTRSIAECNIHELIRQPKGVDKNEWIANNIVAFFNHVNSLYNVLCDFCTPTTCPSMIGPQNSVYCWIDEKNKKIKHSAPQYIELSMVFIQKTLSDETIFPTRLDQQFPLYFDSLVRKMVRLLFHAVAHIYAVHYRQLIELQLHPHLNSFFLHFISFLITSNIISSDYSTVQTTTTTTNLSSTTSFNLPGSTDAREFRTELESLDVLYQLLANQWRHSYGQTCAQRRKAAQHE